MSEEETLPLLSNNVEYPQRNSISKKKNIIGAFLSILCSFGFSANNFIIKTHQIDFTDFLLVRSFIQCFVYAIYNAYKIFCKNDGGKFYPRRSEHETWKSYLIEWALLIAQVWIF